MKGETRYNGRILYNTMDNQEEKRKGRFSSLSLRLCLVESAIQCNTLALTNDNKREECGTEAVARGSLAGSGKMKEDGRWDSEGWDWEHEDGLREGREREAASQQDSSDNLWWGGKSE